MHIYRERKRERERQIWWERYGYIGCGKERNGEIHARYQVTERD